MKHSSKVYIITFIGPVGVGKSTQMKLAKKYFNSKNQKVIETFLKCNHIFAYFLTRFLIVIGASEKLLYKEGFVRIHPRREVLRRLFPLWYLLDMFSITLKFFFTVYLPFRLGFLIFIEEGLMMTLHSYQVIHPHFLRTKEKSPLLISILLNWIISQKHLNIIFDARNEVLIERRKKRSYRQIELEKYVNSQRQWMKFQNSGDTIFIDTSNESALRVHQNVITALEEHKVHVCK